MSCSSTKALPAGLRAVGAHAFEAPQRKRSRDLGVIGDQRLVAARVDDELVVEALGIGEQQTAAVESLRLDAVVAEARRPEADRLGRRDTPDDAVHHARTRTARHRARVLEERQVGAGLGVLVTVEQVIDGRIVLVDGLRGHPQAEHARVEVDVARRVAGDRGDVVDAVEGHDWSFGAERRKIIARASIAKFVPASLRTGSQRRGRTTSALPPPRRTGSAAASRPCPSRNSIPVAAPISARRRPSARPRTRARARRAPQPRASR